MWFCISPAVIEFVVVVAVSTLGNNSRKVFRISFITKLLLPLQLSLFSQRIGGEKMSAKSAVEKLIRSGLVASVFDRFLKKFRIVRPNSAFTISYASWIWRVYSSDWWFKFFFSPSFIALQVDAVVIDRETIQRRSNTSHSISGSAFVCIETHRDWRTSMVVYCPELPHPHCSGWRIMDFMDDIYHRYVHLL